MSKIEAWQVFHDEFLPRNHVDRPLERKEYRIFEPQWKEMILLWLGREDVALGKKKEFIEALVKFRDGLAEIEHHNGQGLYEDRAYFLAAAGIDEFNTCFFGDAIVKQIVQWGFGY